METCNGSCVVSRKPGLQTGRGSSLRELPSPTRNLKSCTPRPFDTSLHAVVDLHLHATEAPPHSISRSTTRMSAANSLIAALFQLAVSSSAFCCAPKLSSSPPSAGNLLSWHLNSPKTVLAAWRPPASLGPSWLKHRGFKKNNNAESGPQYLQSA